MTPQLTSTRVALIGAGLSALACARRLVSQGFEVVLFEKSRGIGGRMATRRVEDQLTFDHGAQYFTARDPGFRETVDEWVRAGVVAEWKARIGTLDGGHFEEKERHTPRFVGVPRMNVPCRELARGLDVRTGVRVDSAALGDSGWQLTSNTGEALGHFRILLSSVPPHQAEPFVATSPQLREATASTTLLPTWAGMLAFSESLQLDFQGAFVSGSPVSWLACDSAKPGRSVLPETWVIHASNEWTVDHLEQTADEVAQPLLEAFWSATGVQPRTPQHCLFHRWRYAIPPDPLPDHYLYDAERRVGVCGDWCAGPRVEGAYLSGSALANAVIEACSPAD